jgi:hypothetical protein
VISPISRSHVCVYFLDAGGVHLGLLVDAHLSLLRC